MPKRSSPLSRFILFVVCLSVAGCIIAGALLLAAEKTAPVPEKSPQCSSVYWDCWEKNCSASPEPTCRKICTEHQQECIRGGGKTSGP